MLDISIIFINHLSNVVLCDNVDCSWRDASLSGRILATFLPDCRETRRRDSSDYYKKDSGISSASHYYSEFGKATLYLCLLNVYSLINLPDWTLRELV